MLLLIIGQAQTVAGLIITVQKGITILILASVAQLIRFVLTTDGNNQKRPLWRWFLIVAKGSFGRFCVSSIYNLIIFPSKADLILTSPVPLITSPIILILIPP